MPIRRPRFIPRRPRLGRADAVAGAERLAAVCHAVASAEYLAREIDRSPGGLANWSVDRENYLERSPLLVAAVDPVSGARATRAVHVARLSAAVAVLSPTSGPVRLIANASLAASSAALHPRNHYGADGADHVSFMVSAACALARTRSGDTRFVDACLWYLAAQATLSYTASGWVKLTSPVWRSGRAVIEVTRTRTYGDPLAWKVFDHFPRLTAGLERGVLACECLFPAALLFGGRPAPFLAAAMGGFHLANTRVMGLGRFFWAFTSMYPPLLYATDPRRRAGGVDAGAEPRSDVFPRTLAVAAAGAAVALNLSRLQRRRRVRAGRGDERTLATRRGPLRYRIVPGRTTSRSGSPGDGGRPTVILVNGLGAIPEGWEWIATDLSADHRVVTVDRAERRPSADSLDAEVERLADLARAEGEAGPVHLVGHSVGGYLALRAAAEAGPAVETVTLLDASHPGQLRRSQVQATGTAQLGATLRIIAWTMRLGFGELAQRPRTIDDLPSTVRDLAVDRFRDPRLWVAADREWRELLQEFEKCGGTQPATTVPRLVVTAELSEAHDPVHAQLQDEYAEGSAVSRREVIAGADHDDLLYREEHARRVAALVREFVAQATAKGDERASA